MNPVRLLMRSAIMASLSSNNSGVVFFQAFDLRKPVCPVRIIPVNKAGRVPAGAGRNGLKRRET
jgi:hypothetical protein